MKLWYAIMSSKEDVGSDEEAVFLVRAKNPLSCGRLAERKRGLVSRNIDPFVSAAFEIGEDASGEKVEGVIAGPLVADDSLLGFFEESYTYWCRDFPDDDWVNFTKYRETDDYFACVYDEENPSASA